MTRLNIAAQILSGFAANTAIFASNDRCGWCLIAATDADIARYAIRLEAICAASYQMAGALDAPTRFLDALSLQDAYLRLAPAEIIDKLLPIDSPTPDRWHRIADEPVPLDGRFKLGGLWRPILLGRWELCELDVATHWRYADFLTQPPEAQP